MLRWWGYETVALDALAGAAEMTTRRSFLKLLGIGTAALAIAPKIALGDAVEKAISVPPVASNPVLGNQLLTPDMMIRECLKLFTRNMQLAAKVERDFARRGIKIGTTLRVRMHK